MKKLFYFAFAAMLCCGFAACSDDDEGGGNASNLIGSWTLLKEVYIEDGFEDVEDDYSYGECVWIFNEDGTGVISEYGYTYHFTYSVAGKTLKWTEDGYTVNIAIQKLSATELVVQFNDEGDIGRLYFERYE